MCDSIGIRLKDRAFFAKNSDRSPNEPQVIEFWPAANNTENKLKATYIEIDQVPKTHAMLLSRPVWSWGAEMGVNDCGVCIGNEAVFTKGAYGKSGLTGMDLVRLGLERSDSSKAALDAIIHLLEEYGQGGNCGYDHKFYYDNSFLIMDKNELYVLDTSNKEWAYKKSDRASISNRLSIGTDGTAYSSDRTCDFKKRHLEPLYSYFSKSKDRQSLTQACLSDSKTARELMGVLRTHADKNANMFAKSSVGSVCMHAGGLVGDHTTSSMVVELGDITKIWVTGSSTPCISLFKPYAFGNEPVPPVFAGENPGAKEYWNEHERFHRSLIGKALPVEYYRQRDALEDDWYQKATHADIKEMAALSALAEKEEAAFYEKWRQIAQNEVKSSRRYLNYWKNKDLKSRLF